MSKPDTRHYLIVESGVVVAKRALGPDRQADGSWTFPPAPVGGSLVSQPDYVAATVGEPGRSEERLARLLARAKRAEAALLAAQARMGALETAVRSLVDVVAAQGQQIADGRADLTALSATVATHTQRLNQGQAALTALAARVTALENA